MHKPQNDPPGSVIHSRTDDVEQSPPPSDQPPAVRAIGQQQTTSAPSRTKQKGSSAQRRNSTTSRDSADDKKRPTVKRSASSRGIKKSSSKRDLKRSDSKRKVAKSSKESKNTDEPGDKRGRSSLQRTSSSKGLRKSSSKRNISSTSDGKVPSNKTSSLSKSTAAKPGADIREDKNKPGIKRSGSSRGLKKSSSKRDMKRSDSKRKLKSTPETKSSSNKTAPSGTEPPDSKQRPGAKRSSSSKGLKKASSKRDLKKCDSKRKLNKSSNSLQQSQSSLKKSESFRESKKSSSKASEERSKPTRTKSATASTNRAKPSRTLSTPVMNAYDGSSQALGLDSIPESINHSQSSNSRSGRMGPKSSAVAEQSSSINPVLNLSIFVDSAIGHGKRMKIVPGIEIFDESEDEVDSILDDEDDDVGHLQAEQDLSSRATETPIPRQIGQKLSQFKVPMTPGGLVSLSTSSASSRLESPLVGVAGSASIHDTNLMPPQMNPRQSALSYTHSTGYSKDHVGHDSMTSSGGKLSEGSTLSGDSLAQNIFRELDGESTNGMMSMSSQEQNWAWLQSTLEQQEEEIIRQQHNDPPRAPVRQKSNDRLEMQKMRAFEERSKPKDPSQQRRGSQGSAKVSRRQRGGESPTESVPPSKQKSGEAPIERRRSNSSSSSALERRLSGGPVKVVKSSDISALSGESVGQSKISMEINRSVGRRNSSSSLRSQNTQDDTISGSDHLPDSDLADQKWMEHEDADSSSATDDFNEHEIFGTGANGGGDDEEDAYARQYIQRMQEQRMQPQKPVEVVDRKAELLARMGMAKKAALAQQPENKENSAARRSAAHEGTYRTMRVPGQGDDDSNYMPKGYMAGNSSHMAPTTPVVSKASFMPGSRQEMDDYGITPKATNITGVYKASALKHPQLEDLQESFTDLHIGVMSSEASVANSSLSASMTSLSLSLDDRRRFAQAHDSMKDDSFRSSFNHSLTYINEELELTGEQLEMLELGSKVSRSKKNSKFATYYNDDAVSSFDDTAGNMRDSGSNDRSTAGSGTSGSNATTLSSVSTNDVRDQSNETLPLSYDNTPKIPTRNIPRGKGTFGGSNRHPLSHEEDDDNVESPRRPKPLYSSDDEERGKSSSPTADPQAKLKAALHLHADVKQDFASGFDLKSVASAQVSTTHSHHSGRGSNNSSRHSATGSSENSSTYEAIYGKNEMPNVEANEAQFVQVHFGTAGEVQYADNSTVLEEATAIDHSSMDDGMPTLEDFGEDDELAMEEYGGKRRKNRSRKGEKNGALGLFRSKRTDMDESTTSKRTEERRRKSLDQIDELTKSTGTNSVMDRLWKFRKGSTRQIMAGAELMDDSEVSFSSHHSL